MHRTPPRRHPRIAALVPFRRVYVLVVLDAWEVRAVAITRSALRLRRLLLAERPAVVIAARTPAWLKGMRVAVKTAPMPADLLPIATLPELRRFAGTRHEPALSEAVTLADDALTTYAYDPHLSQDRPDPPRRASARRPRARRARCAAVRRGH